MTEIEKDDEDTAEEPTPSEVYEEKALASLQDVEDAIVNVNDPIMMIQHAQAWAILSLVAAVRELADIVVVAGGMGDGDEDDE